MEFCAILCLIIKQNIKINKNEQQNDNERRIITKNYTFIVSPFRTYEGKSILKKKKITIEKIQMQLFFTRSFQCKKSLKKIKIENGLYG